MNQQNTNPYVVPDPAGQKKKAFLVGGGIFVLLLLLALVVFSGKPKPGLTNMQTGMQNLSDAVGIMNTYQADVQDSSLKNDVALTGVLLQGNYQNMNSLYNTTYKLKKRYSSSPKPDKASQQTLDEALSNNQLDSSIITTLQPKVIKAENAFIKAKKSFTKKESLNHLNQTINDLQSIEDILNEPR